MILVEVGMGYKDRATDTAARVVVRILGTRGPGVVVLPGVAVEHAVANVHVSLSMKAVSSRFADGIDDDRALRAVGAEVGGLYLHLLGHVRIYNRDRPARAARIDNVRAIEQVSRAAAIRRAIRVEANAYCRSRRSRIIEVETSTIARAVRSRRNARKDLQQLRDVAALNRQTVDVLRTQQRGALCGIHRRNLTGAAIYRNRFIGRAYCQSNPVHIAHVARIDGNPRLLPAAEALRRNGHRIRPRQQTGKGKVASAIAGHHARVLRALVHQRDLGSGDARSRRIRDRSGETCRRLRPSLNREGSQHEKRTQQRKTRSASPCRLVLGG